MSAVAIIAGYALLIAQAGWWGLLAAGVHVGVMVLAARWKG